MRQARIITAVGLLLLFAASAIASETDGFTDEYSLWIGGRYIDTTDYQKKVSEYRWLEDDFWPQIGLTYKSTTPNSVFYLDGHYYDKATMHGKVATTVADRFKAAFQYRSFRRQTQQDLLQNIETREAGGGKILTHELLDEGADYSYDRREVLSEISVLLSRKNDVRLTAAHRAILKDGHEQVVSNSHCFSCHLVSKDAKVQEQTHDLQVGLDGEVGKLDVGYRLGYRAYKSTAPASLAYYDQAVHPVNGGSGAEFESRLNFSDETVPIDRKPKTQKVSHKVRVKGDAGRGKFASAFSYTTAKNKLTDLASKSWAGTFSYAVPTSPNGRLVARVAVTGVSADDPFVDVATFREGRPGEVTDFDFTRYSSLDRTTADINAEYIHRLNQKMTLSILAGYDRVARKDYPIVDDGLTSSTLTGQARLRYRKGLSYSTDLKLRYEKTSDPFVSGRGLFEANGAENLEITGPPDFVFYWQREELRYQSVTTEPTDLFEVAWRSTYKPGKMTSLNLTAKGSFDKNGDLDSLDVKHSKLNVSASVTYAPSMSWAVSGGLGYNLQKSRGPVSVALFDG
jgi:hypothetical protein